jgi:hypothetical protein
MLPAPEDDIVDQNDPRPRTGFQGISRIPATEGRQPHEEQGGRSSDSA